MDRIVHVPGPLVKLWLEKPGRNRLPDPVTRALCKMKRMTKPDTPFPKTDPDDLPMLYAFDDYCRDLSVGREARADTAGGSHRAIGATIFRFSRMER
jgi:hypothetical protein